MKRTQLDKGERRLVTSEATLRKSLLEVLPSAARLGSPLFTNSKYNSYGLAAHLLDPEAEAFLELALACVDLREHLGFPIAGSVGHLFLSACEESSSSDEHRRGPRKFAEALLESLHNDA